MREDLRAVLLLTHQLDWPFTVILRLFMLWCGFIEAAGHHVFCVFFNAWGR